MTALAIVIPVRPCIKCGGTDRNKYDACKPCAKASSAIWRSNNKDKIKAKHKAEYNANPEKAKAATKAWYEANKDKAKARMLAWHKNNPEKSKAGQDAWAKANPDKIKAYSKLQRSKPGAQAARAEYYQSNMAKFKDSNAAWHAKNPLEGRIHQQNARAKSIGQPGKLSRGLVEKLFSLQQGTCPCCRQPLGDDFQIDHIVASYNGGPNVDSNTQLLRADCNGEKKLQDPINFMQGRGYLI